MASLGSFASEQGNYAQAKAYLQEALVLARQIANHWNLTAVLHEWGELHLKQQQLDVAETAFRETRDIASEGNVEYIAIADYSLARIAAAQGDTSQARRQGQESLALLESLGHRKASEVRTWLDTLPEPSSAPSPATPTAQSSPAYPAGLTAREVEVLRLIAEGLTNVQIAKRLIISLHTVNTHVRSILNKLDATSRTAATRSAMELGIL